MNQMKLKTQSALIALFLYACTLTCSCGHKHDDKEQKETAKENTTCKHKHH
jgi:outer membrane biogenesis lipoprotein LolB